MSSIPNKHLHDELATNTERITVTTRFGNVTGGRASNGAAVWLEVPFALPPTRFADPVPLPDGWKYEEGKEYLTESNFAAQPTNNGQRGDTPQEDVVGFGNPTEDPLFVTIAAPPSFPERRGFPVKVFVHGGFLQFGSPHGLKSQNQFISAERSEVWVNMGYRVSAFGFLACEAPGVNLKGNYGFKDQWVAILWVKDNIEAFGGNPNDIQISGLSAGAHSVHQILHYASHLPKGVNAPFHSAILQSNAIIATPKTPAELRPQFDALCRALGLDPRDPDILKTLQTDVVGTEFGTFRGCVDNDWMLSTPDTMEWQRSGGFAAALKEKGVKCVVVGETREEWYLYSIAHPVKTLVDVQKNLERYYDKAIVEDILHMYPPPEKEEEIQKYYGDIFSDWQVYLPVRILAKDLLNAGYPALRYQILWVPEQCKNTGYVTHGVDRVYWAFRLPMLYAEKDVAIARKWLETVFSEINMLQDEGKSSRGPREVLALKEDKTIGWIEDAVWEEKMRLCKILPERSS
ncbi:carboxylesterase [Desarmillaria tabescens]|uniref:Carboxylic ester hydrolase n=1 Tax=Armillaria tabescens TaxID=1929756 RepID=A0AA39KDP5_ARMTA|nr:carboxylesterase [Desarmillaria tabescens]KAK0459277.1 carboxylesterase [Desarmillaria tabescens]